jgi:plastocyanin
MPSMRTLAALAAAAAALALSACGGDDESDAGSSAADSTPAATETATPAAEDSGGGGETIALAADPGGAIKFDKTELTAKAGKATIDFTNDSAVPHAVEIEGNGAEEAKTDTITKSSAKLEIDLKPGKYEFYCPVGDHRAEGMEGTLTVE